MSLERWNHFWFRDADEYDPMGLVRMLAIVLYTQRKLPRDLRGLENALDLPPELVVENFGLRWLPLDYPLPGEWLEPFRVIMTVACAFAFVGFLTRPALLVVATGALYLASGYAALDLFDHEQVLTLSLFWILAVYPSGASFSVDAALRWWRRGRGEGRSWRTIFSLRRRGAWGYRLALATLCIVYLTAGVSKLRYSNGDWLNGETLAFYVARPTGHQFLLGASWERVVDEPWKSPFALVDHGYGYGSNPKTRFLAEQPLLMRALSIATVGFELGAFALLGPPLVAAAYLAGAFAVHTAIGEILNLPFSAYRCYILLLIPWPALRNAWRSRFGSSRAGLAKSDSAPD